MVNPTIGQVYLELNWVVLLLLYVYNHQMDSKKRLYSDLSINYIYYIEHNIFNPEGTAQEPEVAVAPTLINLKFYMWWANDSN